MTKEKETKTTKFQSPVPLLIKFREIILGRKKPDVYTRITFYINTVIVFVFWLWSIGGYIAIVSRDLIFQEKGIPVGAIIEGRGIELGFNANDFIRKLLTFYLVAAICWSIALFGLVFLYRKRKEFVYFILGGVSIYLGMLVVFMGVDFFLEDTTGYDKIALLILVTSATLHAYLLNNEHNGGSISFFGEADDIDDE